MTTLTQFADLIASRQISGQTVRFQIPDDWQQGVTAYGGLVAAIGACAIRDVLGEERALRALQVNFVGSVPAGPAAVQVTTLRSGKSVTQAQAIVSANGETACVISAVLALSRENSLAAFALTQPSTRPAEALDDLPFIPGRTPAFFQHFRSRWAEGDPPASAGSTLHSRIWMQLNSNPVNSELLCILFADAMPSPIMSTARSKVFGASLAWTLEFLPPSQQVQRPDWWRADTELTGHGQGYANQVTTLWTPQGLPAARSQQVVAIYA